MRVRLTDGTHEIEIRSKGYSRRRLDDVEAAALRILDALRNTRPTQAPPGVQFGFAVDARVDADLDGVSLDSSTERAEPYDDGRDQDDEDDDA